jgi:hypothetical protein
MHSLTFDCQLSHERAGHPRPRQEQHTYHVLLSLVGRQIRGYQAFRVLHYTN